MNDKKTRGWLLVAIGATTVVLLGGLAWSEHASATPRFNLATFFALAIVAVAAIATGVASLKSVNTASVGIEEEPASYRHTYRIFAVLIIGLLTALGARSLAVPSDFGTYGHYRAGAPKDAMVARTPRFQGKQTCLECHEVQYTAHEKDVHRTVQCEDCHGPADAHVKDPKTENIKVPKTKEWCLVCHRMLSARPGSFPQVSWKDHFKFVGVKDEKVECIQCHDPHEPLFLQKPLAEARLHPLIQRCRDCHIGRPEEKVKQPADHPATFECGYCHAQKVKDFADTPHSDVPCTTCHLFLKESDFAGRIVLNRDPRFCLLCHEKKEFRAVGPNNAVQIEWPKHLADKDVKVDETTPCVSCHGVQLHGEKPAPDATAKEQGK